jgi:alcohol/geraniol dehydrogenase (NADP+)
MPSLWYHRAHLPDPQPMSIRCRAALGPHGPLSPFEYEPSPLGPWDVEVEISHCGICHSDVHLINNDWGISRYPLVPGHEIVGRVAATGSAVTPLRRGERVGIGWQRSACGACEWCLSGFDNLCPEIEATCVRHYGGFAERIRADSRYCFPLPDALDSATAAPLLCGGITVYSPMRHHGVHAGMRVGVIGIGGLGHLALQYARALGCEVTAFSSTPGKAQEARSLGAHHFVDSTDAKAMTKVAASQDFILNTVSADIDWPAFVKALRPNGKLCVVGVGPGDLRVSPDELITGQKTICGSAIGGGARIAEMLEFSTRHDIQAKIELLPMAEATRAVKKVEENRARYRMVLENA